MWNISQKDIHKLENMAIKSLVGFIKTLNKIKKDKGFEYFYRGHADFEFKLLPGIYRNGFIKNENNIFKEIVLKVPNDFINENTAIEKLVKMQHYGLPTRLLDITSNPLVALYFACNEFLEKDGEVIIFKIPKDEVKFYDSDTVSILANLAKRPATFNISKIQGLPIDEFNKDEEIGYLLHEIRAEKSHFLPIIKSSDLSKVIPVKVKHNNQRIIRQLGAFFIFGINNSKVKPALIPTGWTLRYNELIIDKTQKNRIILGLDKLGINISSLFPEIENQANYLKRHYEKK
jgi:hypothetical protein